MNRKKIALVTGASKGIGKSIAKTLVEAGYSVYVCARNSTTLETAAKEIHVKGFISTDLSIPDNCEKLIKKVIEQEGAIDILINNAGDYIYSPIETTKETDIERLIKLNIEK